MTEEFLHYIWKYKLFNTENLKTEDDQLLVVSNNGQHNFGSGPDFSNAKVKVGDITWAGNVEIHLKSSDWYKHGHQNDPVYAKTILHIVWEHDKPVYDSIQNEIPVLVLNGRVSKSLVDNFNRILLNSNPIMCSEFTNKLDAFHTSQWLHRVLIERLERKVKDIKQIYESTQKDWEQTFFIVLSRNFGFKTNTDPMGLLAKSVDFKILLKNQQDLFTLESILFGVSGLIPEESKNTFVQKLVKEFEHQRNKYGLETLPQGVWKFGRVRPVNFPTLRISQLANLIHENGNLFHVFVRDFDNTKSLELLKVKTSSFWDNHFVFHKESETKEKRLGQKSIENVLINTVGPMLFFYGKETQSTKHQDMALDLLDKLPAENNFVTRNWAQNNIFASNASISQGLIELTNSYCTSKKCLHCGIGKQVLKNEVN